MRYNEKYDLYIDDDLVIYYWDKKKDKLMQKTITKSRYGYLLIHTKIGTKCIHTLVYETFVGSIPVGYQIDHINTIKTDNRLENLKLVTPKENMNNPLTLLNLSRAMKGNTNKKGNITSEFSNKFKEHYGISRHQNLKLYYNEWSWYRRHNHKCRWE